MRLHREAQRVVHQQVVVDAAALGEFQLTPDAAEAVVIDADLVQLGVGPVEQDLHHDVVGARPDLAVLLAEDLQVADDVAQVARGEHRGLLQREGAVEDHPLVLAVDQADRHAAVGVLARDDDVERIVGEHLDPVGQPLLVERRRVGRVERLHLVVQHQRLQALVGDFHASDLQHDQAIPYIPMASRQCRYMARMAASEIRLSAVPKGVAGSSLTRCCPSGTRCMPSCTNLIASLSSSPRKPAGPIRLPWRRRWRVISSSSPSKPNIVHFMMNSCGPVGTIWRMPSVFISRCTIRFGQMVAMVTDHGLSNSSMKFMKRGSRSVMPSLYARISFLASLETLASDLADAITPCRPLASVSISERLPATSRPKVTRNVCSSVA